jgi:D-lactate dehydrogenase (quinone)
MLPQEFLDTVTTQFSANNIFTDPVDCYAYAYDNSRRICPPELVLFPLDIKQIQFVMRLCNQHRVPVTPRGRGTGTAGGSLPERGGVALSLERMRRFHADTANRIIVSEPGVLNQEVQDEARRFGFFWPPDPSSAAYCTIGGNLATGAGGPHAVKYGTTRDHVLGLTAVTGAGETIKTGCYTTKGVVGYDLTRLIIGSEGTLAIIAECTLKLTPLPSAISGIVAYYRNAESCADAITRIMSQPYTPSALEFLDQGSLNLIRTRNTNLFPANAHTLLMIEIDGSESEIFPAQNSILEACKNPGCLGANTVPDIDTLWVARKTLSPLLKDIAPKKINEDIVVPVSRLPELLSKLSALATKYQVSNVNFGHAGNGNIHVNLLVDPDDKDQLRRGEQCLNEIFDLVIKLNGTLSGEHGIGSEKRAYITKEIDDTTISLMKSIKRVFDPNNILNPGKIFPA